MSAHDLVVGLPLGYVRRPPRRITRPPESPRRALERVVQSALEGPGPCVVAFSGGRDSSVVLAVATHVARREGLPEPVPVTRVYPEVPASEEREWQELVLRQLGVAEWVREEITDEMDVVGPMATRQLLTHGVLWSPLLHGDDFFLRHARGGSVLDGEGGDDVCDPHPHRIAPLARIIRRGRLRRGDLRRSAAVLAPGRLRGIRTAQRTAAPYRPWLTRAGQRLVARAVRDEVARQPLHSARSVVGVLLQRRNVELHRNRRAIAAAADVRFVSPLMDPVVTSAFASAAGRLGFIDRAEALALVADDLLPRELLERRTKAEFSASFYRQHTRAFAEGWTGGGVDHRLVDATVLRDAWLGDDHNALSAAMLQAAWLHDHGGS